MQSPCFPLPDLSHTIGKNKEELLAISREHAVKTEVLALMRLSPKEELPMSAEIKYIPIDETSGKEDAQCCDSVYGGQHKKPRQRANLMMILPKNESDTGLAPPSQ